jgi:hypothetical protein
MKQPSAITVIKASSLIGIAAVALTVLSTLPTKYVTWWITIRSPLYQVALLIVAFWGWTPEDRDRFPLLIVGVIRLLVTTGIGFASLPAMFNGVSLIQVGSLLQTAAAALFVIGVIMYGKEKRERE